MLSAQLERESHDQGLAGNSGQNKTVHKIKDTVQPVSLNREEKKNTNIG